MHYYKFNIGDYARRTRYLTLLEDLAYRRLLDQYYLHEQPFDPDLPVSHYARIIGMPENDKEVGYVLDTFFPNGHNRHADKELEAYLTKSDKARASAMARWKDKEESESNANAMRTHSDGNANHKPLTNNHKPINNTGEQSPPVGDEASPPKRINYQEIVDAWNATMANEYPRQKKVINETLKKNLRARCKNEFPDIDSWITYFEFIKQSDFLMGKAYSGDRPFQISLEWVIKPTNLTKIIEGAYHHG